jgi:hypothetical protein
MDLLPELPARLASKRFAQVLNRLFHALRYGLVYQLVVFRPVCPSEPLPCLGRLPALTPESQSNLSIPSSLALRSLDSFISLIPSNASCDPSTAVATTADTKSTGCYFQVMAQSAIDKIPPGSLRNIPGQWASLDQRCQAALRAVLK